jgi:polar amino acid transport system substrate-binding protein
MNHKTQLCFITLFSLSSALAARTTIELAAEDDWFPYSAKIGTAPQGFSVELISAAYDAAGATVTYKVVPFSRAMAGVKNGTYAGCFNAGVTGTLKAEYHIPKQFIALSVQAVWGNLSAPPIKSYKDFEGKTVGIANAYTYSPLLIKNEKIKKDVAPYEVASLKKVAHGRIDYTIVDRWVAKYLISTNASEIVGKIKQVGVVQTDTIVPVFSKSHPDGAKAMELYEKGMAIIKRNGTYDKIMNGWEAKFEASRPK